VVHQNKRYPITIVIVCYLVVSCSNPFSTRKPEPPLKTDGGLPLKVPNTSVNALENMRISWEGRSVSYYLDVLSDDFTFIPDKNDEEAFPQVYQPGTQWDKTREEEFVTKFFSTQVADLIVFEDWKLDPPKLVRSGDGGKNDEYRYHYKVGIVYTDGLILDAPKRLVGTARIFLKEEGGSWFIYRWEDIRTDSTPETYLGTWGVLRARF
jgi:hypothetical protein